MIIRNNKLRYVAVAMAGAMLLSSCASTTMIQSVPENAKLYINGEPVGETPYKYTDEEIIFSTTDIRIEKDGYEPLYTSITRDEELDAGPVVGGFFFCPIFLLWAFKYEPTHTYELIPLSGTEESYAVQEQKSITDQKAEQLRQIKSLLDEGVLTPEEYEREKAKILEE